MCQDTQVVMKLRDDMRIEIIRQVRSIYLNKRVEVKMVTMI